MDGNKCKKCGAIAVGAAMVIYITQTISPTLCKDCEKKIGRHAPENKYEYVLVNQASPFALSGGTQTTVGAFIRQLPEN